MAWYDFLNPVGSVFGKIAGIIKDPLVQWQKTKTVRAESKAEIEKILANVEVAKATTQLEMAKNGQKIEADWDSKAQEQAKHSWKDEALLILLFFPVGVLFVAAILKPEYVNKIIDAVKALNEFPMWYQVMLLGVVASVFGLRWLIGPLVNKMNNKK